MIFISVPRGISFVASSLPLGLSLKNAVFGILALTNWPGESSGPKLALAGLMVVPGGRSGSKLLLLTGEFMDSQAAKPRATATKG